MIWRDGARTTTERDLATETPVALVHDGSTYAVMMATPADLEDLALGFAFTEGVIASPADVLRSEVASRADGIEARLWLTHRAGPGARRAEATAGGTDGVRTYAGWRASPKSRGLQRASSPQACGSLQRK